ncbi:MAG: anaerobic ribonucleoside-triphosphate reductase activating protein, partial [Bacteroidales bacterium]
MNLAGLQPTSLIDYPGTICAVVFTQGCNLTCPFCHNPGLIPYQGPDHFPEEEFFAFLEKRKGKLDGISITGGEPLLQPDLIPFIKRINEMGFKVKLDTNGTLPKKLKEIINSGLLDFLAMDIKSSLQNYSKAVGGIDIDVEKIKKSVELIRDFQKYEFRTTVVPGLVSEQDIKAIGSWLEGIKNFSIQQFKNENTYASDYRELEP